MKERGVRKRYGGVARLKRQREPGRVSDKMPAIIVDRSSDAAIEKGMLYRANGEDVT